MHEPGDRREHLLGRGRVERGGRLVEHEHLRVRGEHRADRDPLLLAAREAAQRPGAQLGEAEQVERLLDPLAHHVGREAELLHPVRELLLDGVGDEAGEWVLADDADDVGEVAGRVRRVSRPSTVDAPARCPPVKCGTSPLIAPSSVDLPDPGRADDEAQLALVDREVDVAQHGVGRFRHA